MKLQKKGDFVMKKIISIILICSMLLALLSGCSYFDKTNDGGNENKEDTDKSDPVNGNCSSSHLVPEGYTGGFSYDSCLHAVTGFYWLETYEEVLEAIELLASHGSTVENKQYGNTVKRSIGFNYEGDLFDVKWCFRYSRSKAEPLEEGKSFFDRRIDEGEFVWYAFAKDVTIDKLVYSDYEVYGPLRIYYPNKSFVSGLYNYIVDVENVEDLYFDWFGRYDYGVVDHPLENSYYEIMYQGELVAEMTFDYNYPLPIESHKEFLSTMVVVE